MPKDVTELLKEATKDLLTEDTLKQIESLFNESVEKKVTDKVSLQLEAKLNALDEKHAKQLQTLLEKIDVDHAAKLEKIVAAINESHTRKLKAVVAKYQQVINEEAKQFKTNLVGTISNYLELYLEKTVPVEAIQEAVKVKKSVKLLNEMRKMLGVDLALGQEVIKEGILDGKQKLTEAAAEKADLLKENADLKARAEKAEVTLLLEQKTAALPKEKKQYVVKMLSDKDASFITENFDYTLAMFDKAKEEELETLKESAKPVTRNIVNPSKKDETKVIEEGVEHQPEIDVQIQPYLSELKKY